MVSAPSRRAAFFDVDRTVLRGSSLLALARPLRRAGIISTRVTVRAVARQLLFGVRGMSNDEIEAAVASLSAVIAGMDATAVRRVTDQSVAALVGPRVYDEAWRLIEAHHRHGDQVFLVSASPHELIDALGKLLGADGVVATDAEVKGGRYTGRIPRLCHGPAKAEAVRELAAQHGIDLGASYAYGDSMSDLPMLEAVGHPVAVNPDRRLRAEAERRGWKVRSFRHRTLVARLARLRHTGVPARVTRAAKALPGRVARRAAAEVHR